MKTPRFLFVFAVVFFLAACGGTPLIPETGNTMEQPTVEEPTAVPPTSEPVQASPVVLTATQPQFAPFCESAPSGCQAPTVRMLDNKYCIDKVPYAIMSVAAGTTYETSDLDFQCVDQMHSDGTMRVTCHSVSGKELWSFDLKVCNSACSVPVLQTGSGQCPEGYGYDQANQCCAAPAPASSDGCTIYQVDLGACIGS
jgi:hypothetical protein